MFERDFQGEISVRGDFAGLMMILLKSVIPKVLNYFRKVTSFKPAAQCASALLEEFILILYGSLFLGGPYSQWLVRIVGYIEDGFSIQLDTAFPSCEDGGVFDA